MKLQYEELLKLDKQRLGRKKIREEQAKELGI